MPAANAGTCWAILTQRAVLRRLVLLTMLAVSHTHADSRHSARDISANWHPAVVKLSIPVTRYMAGDRHHLVEDCTGSIITNNPVRVLTAWHCFDGMTDLTRPATARIDDRWYATRLIRHGASMASDWALLELQSSPPSELPTLTVSHQHPAMGASVIMAGFSGDASLGENGAVLTWDSGCEITGTERYWGRTDCTAFKGASGGPVLLERGGAIELIGVISAKNEQGATLFTPASRFFQRLR